MSEQTEVVVQDNTNESPSQDNVVRFATPKALKRAKAKQRHDQKVVSQQRIRWTQPSANAKIEDMLLLAQDFRNLVYEQEVLEKVLIKLGVITEQNIIDVKERDKLRLKTFEQLQKNTEMPEAEKRAAAAEWEIPLELLGLAPLTETPEKENG